MSFIHPLKAGHAHVRKINEDRSRVRFAKRLLSNEDVRNDLTVMEADFLVRIEAEHNKPVPDIFSGDCNIIDSLRRKYQARLDATSTTDKH